MGSVFHMLVPKHDTVDSNSHCPYGHKATGTFTFFKSHIRRHKDSTTEPMIIIESTKA